MIVGQERIREGDVVELRSGSPPLVVVKADTDEEGATYVMVAWMNADEDMRQAPLPVAAIKRHQPG